MKLNRRGFLKLAGGLVAMAAAPVFIPAERLDFGVPRALVTARPNFDEAEQAKLLYERYLLSAEGMADIHWQAMEYLGVEPQAAVAPAFTFSADKDTGLFAPDITINTHKYSAVRFGTLVDRSYEGEIRRMGDVVRIPDGQTIAFSRELTDREFLAAWKALDENGRFDPKDEFHLTAFTKAAEHGLIS